MPAPTKSFTVIPDSDVDPDSPVTTALMTALRDNDQHLEEWLGMSYTAAQDHSHNGTDSAIINANGASLPSTMSYEIYDHFTEDALSAAIWQTTTNCSVVVDEHYLQLGTGAARGILRSQFAWYIEQVAVVLEMRVKANPVNTDWPLTYCGICEAAPGRFASFQDEATADEIRCRTVGSGGTETTDDIAVGGGGLDAWHVYKIDQTSTTQTVFSLDGSVVATHATAVPDAVPLNVYFYGTLATDQAMIDYVRFYATGVTDSTA